MRRTMRSGVFAALCLLLAACGGSDREPRLEEARRLNAPGPGESAMDRPHVVFSRRSLVIDQLGIPVDAPVSVGSTPSPATMRSGDSSVVEVTGAGQLLARHNGTAWIETLHGEGAKLLVEVKGVDAIALVPPGVELSPGASTTLALVDAASGEHLSPSVAEWRCTPPGVAIVRDGAVTANGRPGTAQVIVRYGLAEARADVVVRGSAGKLLLSPEKVRLRVGEVRAFQAFSDGGAVTASWSTRDGRVIAHLGQTLFQARSVGRTKVCASALGSEGCSDVEVER